MKPSLAQSLGCSIFAHARIQYGLQGLKVFLAGILARVLVVFLAGLVSTHAWAITRIGNAKFGSDSLGFEGTLAKPFVFLREEPNQGALLISMGDGILRDGEPLSVYTLEKAVPGIQGHSRDEFRTLFGGSLWLPDGWTKVYAKDSCVDAFVSPSVDKQNFWGVASWGASKGIVFFGANKASVSSAITLMLMGLEVKEGACAWE